MKKGISVKDKMDSFHLSFETKELEENKVFVNILWM